VAKRQIPAAAEKQTYIYLYYDRVVNFGFVSFFVS